MMRKPAAQFAMYGGAITAVASAIAELEKAPTWAEVMTPAHVFGALGALLMAYGALYHPSPSSETSDED